MSLLQSIKRLYQKEYSEEQFAVRIFFDRALHHSDGLRCFYFVRPKDAKFLLKLLNHKKPNGKEWKKVYALASKSDNRIFDAPKHPISISIKSLKVIEGNKRLFALAVAKKPAILWIDLKD